MHSRLQKMVLLFLSIVLFFTLSIEAKAKDDITGNTHETDIRKMIELEIMFGYGEGEFRPGKSVTRGQFATMMARALHLEQPDEPITFVDVSADNNSLNEITAAAGAGFITGDKGYFKPNEHITRQHMAVIMKRALDYMYIEEHTEPLMFADKNQIFSQYHNDISTTVHYGIFQGDGNNFKPQNFATRGHAAAAISRFLTVVETGEVIPPPKKPVPPVPDPEITYSVASIQNDGSTKLVKKYSSYESAASAAKTDQAILFGEDIIKMPGGIVVTKPVTGKSTTDIFTTSTLKSAFTYVSADTELEYVGSTDKFVEIKLAGKVGFIKQEHAYLKPWKAVKGRSYYSVSNGSLTHHIYSNATEKHTPYIAGKAPSFLKAGERYYSWNGYDFTNASGKGVGKAYQYFQYLPARSTTAYSAKEIDAYILKMLADLEKKNPNHALYKTATKDSKLIGLGEYLKKIEKEHKVNAMLILSLAQHESQYGLSVRAQVYNNLFGIRVTDDNPADLYFKDAKESVDELMNFYFNKNYIPPNAPYANGAVFGNKAMGFNVKYASDPYWGAKAAGHWYRADQMMGGKDAAKNYKVGLTTTALNVRTGPAETQKRIFRYEKTGMPVIIAEEVQPKPWLKIISDTMLENHLYVHGNYVQKIPVAK